MPAAAPGRARRSTRLDAAALGALVALAAGIRFSALGAQSFWLDEAFTWSLVRRSFGGMLSALPHVESTPPLYFVLAWAWSRVFGTGEAALRSLSALIGTVTVPVAYVAARGVLEARARLLLAALVATSPFLVWYSQEARAYSLLALLAPLSFLFLQRACRAGDRTSFLWWALAAALLLATHYFAGFLVAAEAGWLLWRAPDRRVAIAAVAAVLAVAAALVPLALAQRANNGASGFAASALGGRVWAIPREFLVGQYGGPVRGLAPLGAAAVALALVLLVRAPRAQLRRLALPAFLVAASVALPLLLAAGGFDYVVPRHLIVAWPFVFMLVAAGLTCGGRLGQLVAVALVAVFAVASIAVPLTPRLERDDWRGAAAALGPARGPRAIVVSPSVGFVPLYVYARAISPPPHGRFTAAEIDLLAMTRSSPRPPLPVPAAGFRLVERIDKPTYSLARYRAAAPREVTISALLAHPLTRERVALVYEGRRRH
jgi:hypothetical protein